MSSPSFLFCYKWGQNIEIWSIILSWKNLTKIKPFWCILSSLSLLWQKTDGKFSSLRKQTQLWNFSLLNLVMKLSFITMTVIVKVTKNFLKSHILYVQKFQGSKFSGGCHFQGGKIGLTVFRVRNFLGWSKLRIKISEDQNLHGV